MPHLPPVEILGGSVTIEIPINEVNAQGDVLNALFKKKKKVIETYPEGKEFKSLREKEEQVIEAHPNENNYKSLLEREEHGIGTYPNGKGYQSSVLEKEGCDLESRPHRPGKYTIRRFKASESQIYLIQIYGDTESEVFEFRPRGGKCKVKIYYAEPDEMDEVEKLMNQRKWPPAEI